MYIFDTDHLSVLERGGTNSEGLIRKLKNVKPNQVAVTIISYEEQTRGWLSCINQAKSIEHQVKVYKRLKQQLSHYCSMQVLEFDERAATEFQRLKKIHPRLGTMDLKIAAIGLANEAIILTRNSKDYGKIEGLSIEDWTI